ncbi:MAG: antibiotic biosynthesis monooxygenase [Pseudomonadota bacterium]
MPNEDFSGGPVIRLFQVKAKPGRAPELMEKFATTSADVVHEEPGNRGYFYGKGLVSDEDYVVFASVWQDLEAVKTRFGDAWQTAFLPPGYDALIEECSIRHIDVGKGWCVALDREQ